MKGEIKVKGEMTQRAILEPMPGVQRCATIIKETKRNYEDTTRTKTNGQQTDQKTVSATWVLFALSPSTLHTTGIRDPNESATPGLGGLPGHLADTTETQFAVC